MHGKGGHAWKGGTCVAKGGMYGEWGHVWHEGVHGRGHELQKGACILKEGMCGRECMHVRWVCVPRGCACRERRPLKQAVRILMECILI